MILTRRRFIAISAACLSARPLDAATWRGRALGADAQISLRGDRQAGKAALREAQLALRAIEAAFSIYDPASELSRLNAAGTLSPSPRFSALLDRVDPIWRATGAAFDPSIQPLWHALATGADISEARARVGWDRVRHTAASVRLDRGQQLSFNGIAQGAATDEIVSILRAHGFEKALVNIGEYAGLGGPWRLGLTDPQFGQVAQVTLRDGAVATSSPGAMKVGRGFHIVDPRHGPVRPKWSTVTVEAEDATTADGLSTALCLMTFDQARKLRRSHPGVRRIVLVDWDGNLRTV
ncbi:FAD:protein FMN transferase [Aliiroseovarius sp. PTFE2010]|uniref:FAD:protein FMN transferase n=1 Tax=Aliiroseovarius sp. PTFE2010 TaxID=3417190 RepID=UPI003CE75019